ncbi:hypothetical protein MJG53_003694 [Ovis ammon polii x Ovis aries]|uniref:Uncharacterized protein n=1 Tax=Ovis ammon polii x Ovis aries TaxID=2918886 RepID=A0ACB9VHS3_9CETA|nr:hypothetical protein MJG53_003694 [Ovis ammon polii x Ovis aries]
MNDSSAKAEWGRVAGNGEIPLYGCSVHQGQLQLKPIQCDKKQVSPKCSSFLYCKQEILCLLFLSECELDGGLKESGGSQDVLMEESTLDKIIERYLMSSDCDSMGESWKHGRFEDGCSNREHSQGQITQKKTHGRGSKGEEFDPERSPFGSSFKPPSDLIKHLRVYLRKKSRRYNEGKKPFSFHSDLVPNRKEHSGEKPRKCNEGRKALSHSSSRTEHQKHQKSRGGEKSQKCSNCGVAFTQSSSLNEKSEVYGYESRKLLDSKAIIFYHTPEGTTAGS